jgi:hypothetical protein
VALVALLGIVLMPGGVPTSTAPTPEPAKA